MNDHAAGASPVDCHVVPLVPKRVTLSRAKGWRMPPGTVKVDRSTKWGNPFVRHSDGTLMDRGVAVQMFSSMLDKYGAWWPIPMPWPKGKIPDGSPTTQDDVRRELRGKNLACWCHQDQPCHADVLLRLANDERRNVRGAP